mmetsp:Transcript_10049/g.11742  ORF Transcript_10049/g.11742 Transcript_10049/m.11742 type:complete len:97 (+) Transcript_10049:24-314(+)
MMIMLQHVTTYDNPGCSLLNHRLTIFLNDPKVNQLCPVEVGKGQGKVKAMPQFKYNQQTQKIQGKLNNFNPNDLYTLSYIRTMILVPLSGLCAAPQ